MERRAITTIKKCQRGLLNCLTRFHVVVVVVVVVAAAELGL